MDFFWRRQSNVWTSALAPVTHNFYAHSQYNNLGVRYYFSDKVNSWFVHSAFLGGFDSKLFIPANLTDVYFRGISVGGGYSFNNWSIDLMVDGYVTTPLPGIPTGFAWDRIRISFGYKLPFFKE
jgi:hypothetical protein